MKKISIRARKPVKRFKKAGKKATDVKYPVDNAVVLEEDGKTVERSKPKVKGKR